MKNKLTVIMLTLGIIVTLGAGSFSVFAQRCEQVQSEVLRLHIPANSDSDEDQTIKLRLRDFVLENFSDELSKCESLPEAEACAETLLPEIERECTEFLRGNGFSYAAHAEICEMYFPTREYDRLILPAGRYTALRITLGEGAGHNWWCVIFPQLCLPAVSDNATSEDILSSFGKPQPIKVKFAVYEWITNILQK